MCLFVCISLSSTALHKLGDNHFREGFIDRIAAFIDLEENREDPVIPEGDVDDELHPNSQTVSYEHAISIVFSASGVTVNNPFEGNGVNIENNNGLLIIRSSVTDKELKCILQFQIKTVILPLF